MTTRAQIYQHIADYTRVHGYPPTYREIAAALGITNPTVWYHVDMMARLGVVRKQAHRARSVQLKER